MFSSSLSLPTTKSLSLLSIAYVLFLLLPLAVLGGRSGLDICFTFLGLTFLIDCIKQNHWTLFKPAWVKLSLVIWLYLFIRSLFVPDVSHSIDRGLFFGRFILGALGMQWVIMQRPGAAKRFFQLMSAVVGFIVIDVFIQYFTGEDLFGKQIVRDRLTGPFSDVRVGSVLMMLAFPVVCWALTNQVFNARMVYCRILGLVVTIAFIGAVFVSGERMAFIMTVFGLCIAIFLLPNQKKLGLMLLAIMAVLFASLSLFNPKILERQFSSSQAMITHIYDSPYGQIWRNAVKVGMQQPLVGVGPRQYRKICPTLPALDIHDYPIREQCNLHTHHFYLEWFTETGLIGLGLFIALVGLWLREFIQAFKRDPNQPILIGLFVFVVIFLWPLKTAPSFFTNVVALPFWMVLGWGLALTKQHPKECFNN